MLLSNVIGFCTHQLFYPLLIMVLVISNYWLFSCCPLLSACLRYESLSASHPSLAIYLILLLTLSLPMISYLTLSYLAPSHFALLQ
jgi:hypothetical protein